MCSFMLLCAEDKCGVSGYCDWGNSCGVSGYCV